MLKVNIVAVGKIKEKYFQEAVLEYQKRFEYLWTVNSKEKSDMWFELRALKDMAKKVKK